MKHEFTGRWKTIEVENKHRNANMMLKTILLIWSFKPNIFPDEQLMKHKTRIWYHGGIKKWGVNYWETYAPAANWISVRLFLEIASIHELPIISIDLVPDFHQVDLYIENVWSLCLESEFMVKE